MQVQNLTPAQVATAIEGGSATLVDVREPGEFAAERIPGAVLHPLSRFDAAALPAGQLIFACGIGKRSLVALEQCRHAGLAHDAHLAGGLAAWKKAGLPTARGAG